MITPKRPTGSGPDAQWCQWVHDTLLAMRTGDVPDSIVSRTTRGVFSRVKAGKGGGVSGFSYLRDFDPTHSGGYSVNDIVRVKSGGSQGIFICILANPIDAGSGVCVAPAYPENSYWDMWAFGVKEVNICNNGDGHLYIQSSDVF